MLSTNTQLTEAEIIERAKSAIRTRLGQLVAKVKTDPDVISHTTHNPFVRVLITVPEIRYAALIVFTRSVDGELHHNATLVNPMYGSDDFPQCWPNPITSFQNHLDAAESLKLMLKDKHNNRRTYIGWL